MPPLKDHGKMKDWQDPNSLKCNQKESMGKQDTARKKNKSVKDASY